MEYKLYWIFAFNVIINSLFSFFTTLFFVELFVTLLRVKHPRVKALCRSLPFFKICLDFTLYHFANWALCHGLNPIEASGTRQFSLYIHPFTGIQFSMQEGQTFSLADVFSLLIGPFWTRFVVLCMGAGTCIALILKLIQILQEKRNVNATIHSAVPLSLQLSSSLKNRLDKKQIVCLAISGFHSPCIVGKKILFPAELIDKLSSEEIEAVIAHEIAHERWKDCALRLTCSLIAAFFWWIPTRKWQKRLEEMQERAADLMIYPFKISRFALGEALLKTAHYTRESSSQLAFFFVSGRPSFQSRIEHILQEPLKQTLGRKAIQYGVLGIFLLSLLFGKLWIF